MSEAIQTRTFSDEILVDREPVIFLINRLPRISSEDHVFSHKIVAYDGAAEAVNGTAILRVLITQPVSGGQGDYDAEPSMRELFGVRWPTPVTPPTSLYLTLSNRIFFLNPALPLQVRHRLSKNASHQTASVAVGHIVRSGPIFCVLQADAPTRIKDFWIRVIGRVGRVSWHL